MRGLRAPWNLPSSKDCEMWILDLFDMCAQRICLISLLARGWSLVSLWEAFVQPGGQCSEKSSIGGHVLQDSVRQWGWIFSTVTNCLKIFLALRAVPLIFYLGKHPSNSCWGHLGIALLAFAPPPRTQTGTLGHFFPGRFERLCQITVLRVYKCHKESWQALNPLLTKENT